MKGFLAGVLVTLVITAVGIITVLHLGLYPIGADNPPSALERAIAGRAMDVYADKHKPEGENPTAITPANLADGAKTYEDRCAFCHGGAKAKISEMRDKFSPPAPQLIDRIPHDPDAWLFWVTKHGVRMTAMPSWTGILSDDDIWKVVAYIKHSDKLPPETRRLLSAATASASESR